MATSNIKSITYGGDTYNIYPSNLTSETKLNNAAADATETANRVYPVRLIPVRYIDATRSVSVCILIRCEIRIR